MNPKQTLSPVDGFLYGLLGFPLAFCALPLYVMLPNLYAQEFGVPLTTLGVMLLGARLLDAVTDPFLGHLCDRLYARSLHAVLTFCGLCAVLLAGSFSLLFFPPAGDPDRLLPWAGAMLIITYSAYSAITVAHQSWGAMLGGDAAQRSRIVFWREGLGLVGVVLAALTPSLLGKSAMLALFAASLLLGWLAWTRAVRPVSPVCRPVGSKVPAYSVWHPWRISAFRRLLAVFMLNGIASAVPATLVLFFIQDKLQAPEFMQAVFLGCYFVCGALSMPLWLLGVKRWGLVRCWLFGMAMSITVFLGATQLHAGDTGLFLIVCALSGVALGSDLALPGALLAGVILDAGDHGQSEGAYFGWWNLASKLNLALAAGLALPMLSLLGYFPGAREPQALQALTVAYCLLPCALKALAAGTLFTFNIQSRIQLEAL
ncbi:MAG: MFS transporter [Comamonadaceae bacterium]